MTRYPDIVEVTLTRFYEYEVLNPDHPLTLGIKQALASEIAMVYDKTQKLAFLNQQYMSFRVHKPQILSDEELDTIPRLVFNDLLDFIQTDENRFKQLLNDASQNGLSLILQLLLYSHKNCCSYFALIQAVQQAIKHQHVELMPIFKNWVFKLESEHLNVEELLPRIAAITFSKQTDAKMQQNSDDSNHAEDTTESLHIPFSEQVTTNAGSREHSEDETDSIDYLERVISFTPGYEQTQKASLSSAPSLQPPSESTPRQVSKLTF